VSICAIGPSTAERLLTHGLKPDVVIPEFRAEGVGDTIAAKRPISGQRVLLVRPDHLRDALATDLARAGAIVTDLVAYRTTPESSDSPAAQDLYRKLLDGAIDAVTFTSPTGVHRFAHLFGEEQAADLLNITVVASIGPVTAAAATEFGIKTTVMPDTYTVDGLVGALVEYFKKQLTT
jgi:uroporphyrinogen III methyltransferase/synthase